MTSVVGGDDFNNNTYFFLCGALKLSLNRQDSYPNTQPSCTSWQAAFIDKAEEFCSDLGEKGSCPRFRELDSLGHRSEEVLTQKGESVFFLPQSYHSVMKKEFPSICGWSILRTTSPQQLHIIKIPMNAVCKELESSSLWLKLRLYHWHLKFNCQYCKHDE